MALASMTGFARAEGFYEAVRWIWELRSVNGKGLEIRARLGSGFEALEPDVRSEVSKVLKRGNLSLSLTVKRDSGSKQTLVVNEAILESVLEAMNTISGRIEATKPTLDGILGFKGVSELAEAELSEDSGRKLNAEILRTLNGALADLLEMRRTEGEAIGRVIHGQLSAIEHLASQAEKSPARTVDAIRQRLQEQVDMLMEANAELDRQRLHQEAVLLATKADIREELDRLYAHVAAARDLLSKGGPVGRKLDFLAQEFNRETNTLCSKSNDTSLTAIGLELKAVVDQMREQIQNLE